MGKAWEGTRDKCYDPIRLHQHAPRSRLQNPCQSRPSLIHSVTTLRTPLHTLSDSIPSSSRPFGLLFWYFSLYPFVLLTIGRVPMTHKGLLLLLFLCSMKIAQALVVKLLEI